MTAHHADPADPAPVSVLARAAATFRPGRSAGKHARQPGPLGRHMHGRRSATIALFSLLLAALILPLLLLTSYAPGSPARLAQDPAVRALQTYEAAMDGTPAHVAAQQQVKGSLTFHTLADGTVKVSRVGEHGQCYYLLIPAATDQPTSGIKPGTPADCS